MSEHLSHDQISRWILGQSTPDEEQHRRECPQCSAESIQLRERISTFRGAMQEWSERQAVPKLEKRPGFASRPHMTQPILRWALLGMTSAVLVGIPIYEHLNKPAFTSEPKANSPIEGADSTSINPSLNNADVLLMESVNAHLSRPIPMPMERVMALLPVEVEQAGSLEGFERKETR